jgi:undecaprenol kinase/diacylglycerol kinase (ATP)
LSSRSAWRRFLAGFGYALEGVTNSLITQRNMRFHFAAGSLALLLALVLRLDAGRLLWVLAAVALVISAELMNTAVEHAVNLAMPKRHPLAKLAKDAAAAAVLVLSVLAAAAGVIVFGGPLLDLAVGSRPRPEPDGLATAAAVSGFALLGWCALLAWCEKKRVSWRPGGGACAASVLAALWAARVVAAPWPATAAFLAAALLLLLVPAVLKRTSMKDLMSGLVAGALLSGIALLAGMIAF